MRWPPSSRATPWAAICAGTGPRDSAGQRSLRITLAPRRRAKAAAAVPDRAAPTTTTFLPVSSTAVGSSLRAYRSFRVLRDISARAMAMIQKRTITFGSAQPLSSKMVVQGRHAKYAPAVGYLEKPHLKDHRQRFDDEQAADQHQQNLLFGDDRHRAQSGA